MSNPIQSPVPPDLRALLDTFKVEIFANFNSAKVGTIAAFDATSGPKASVQISSEVPVNGEQLAYPLLTDCPVVVFGGGGGALTFPIAAGDPCVVLFNDFDLDVWFTTGNASAPNSARAHSLSDGIVLVGVHNLANKIADYSGNTVQLKFNGAIIELGATGKIHLANEAMSLYLLFNDLVTTLEAWVNTGGSTPNPATLTALETIRTQANSLLA